MNKYDAIQIVTDNSWAFYKLNDGNLLRHNNEVFGFILIVYIQVVNDATPCSQSFPRTSKMICFGARYS